MIPTRAQMRRVRGFRMGPGGVLCCRPGALGNPFNSGDRWKDLKRYEKWVRKTLNTPYSQLDKQQMMFVDAWNERVRTATKLFCFCRIDQPCHVDVMRKLLQEGL